MISLAPRAASMNRDTIIASGHGQSLARSLALTGVPACWVLLAVVMQRAMGPFSAFDPDYYYLLSAVDLVSRLPVGMYHHPGITAEVFGALVILTTDAVMAPSVVAPSAVLLNPEKYLAVIHLATAALIAGALWVFGRSVLKATEDARIAALLQLSVLLAPVVVNDGISRFKAEPFMIVASLLLMSVIAEFVRSRSASETKFAVLFAVVCGFGLATKFTFLAVAFIPLILLTGLWHRCLFAAATVVAGIFFTLPIADRYDELWRWTYTVASHTGIYGDGAPGIVNLDLYRQGFAALMTRNVLFGMVVAFAVVALARVAVESRQRRLLTADREVRALFALTLSHLVGFALAAKYGSFPEAVRYLLGAYCMLGLTVWLGARIAIRRQPGLASAFPRAAKIAVLVIGAVSLMTTPPAVVARHSLLTSARVAHSSREAALDAVDSGRFEDHARIYDFGFRSHIIGLLQASFYSTGQFEPLTRAYPGVYFCAPGCTPLDWDRGKLTGLDAREFTATEVSQAFDGRVVLFYGKDPQAAIVTPTALAP